MGRGAHGWNGDDGPNPFCAWSLEQLGWVGPDNQYLIEILDDSQGLVISPLVRHGAIYKIPLSATFNSDNPTFSQEYLLLEQRTRTDPEHCEIHIQGKLNIDPRSMNRFTSGRTAIEFMPSRPAVFAAQSAGNVWQGIFLADRAQVDIPDESLVLEDAACGMVQSTADCAVPILDSPTAVAETPSMRLLTPQLQSNYPNPFNAQTTLRFTLPQTAQIQLTIYNTMGQKIRTLINGMHPAGEQTISWDSRNENGKDVASGTYFYRLEVDGHHLTTRQMVLVR